MVRDEPKVEQFREASDACDGSEGRATTRRTPGCADQSVSADHSEPPDEEYDLADRMYEEADRQWDARRRFNALSECEYLN